MKDTSDVLNYLKNYSYYIVRLKGGYFTELTYLSIKRDEIILNHDDKNIKRCKVICTNPDIDLGEIKNFIIANNSCTITDGVMTIELIGQLL